MAKALVFVLVPYSVGPANVSDQADRMLEQHRMPEDRGRGWYDYLCGGGPVFDDPVTEGGLPDKVKRSLHRHVCDASRLPPEPRPHALVTPDGAWHAGEANIQGYWTERGRPKPGYHEANAAASASWPARYSDLVAAHPYCWVVAVWAHS